MDHIYPTKDYKVYNIKVEAEKLMKSVETTGYPIDIHRISEIADCSDEKVKKVALEVCQAFEDYGNEQPLDLQAPFSSFTKQSLELNSTKLLREGNLEFKNLTKTKDMIGCLKESSEQSDENLPDIEMFSDVVITIRFYETFKYAPNIKNHPKFLQEYQVLGSNFLTELRDKFYCVSNFGPFFDISNDPTQIPKISPDSPNPGFFFIHDTFYNDTRNELNQDYSQVILNWYKKMNYVGHFESNVMEGTKFEDLKIRFGYPYVYQHQGLCEHIFCFTSIDLISSSDDRERRNYPKLTKCTNKHSTLCDLCNQSDASFQVTNCPLHVKDPLTACEQCFFSFHYDRDRKKKICDFQAYKIYSLRPDSIDQSVK